MTIITNIRPQIIDRALAEFKDFKAQIPPASLDFIGIVDYGVPSTQRRFHIYDVRKHHVISSALVAHGSGSSDPRHPTMAVSFSNTPNSHMSSVGAVKTGGVYYGRYGRSLRLNGLEKGINNNMFIRAVVLHGSNYVSDRYLNLHGRIGQSWGCLAMDMAIKDHYIDILKGGHFIWLDGGQS